MSESCFTFCGVGFVGQIISGSHRLTENAREGDDDDGGDDEATSSGTRILLMEWRNEVKRKKNIGIYEMIFFEKKALNYFVKSMVFIEPKNNL